MKSTTRFAISTFAILIIASSSFAQIRVSGFVRDSVTREVLVGAHVIDTQNQRGVTTDNNGFFRIVAAGGATLQVSYVGYNQCELAVKAEANKVFEVLLVPSSAIEEVVITQASRPRFDVSTLSRTQLMSIPSLGAKPDVMKSIQLLPGIEQQNEGTSLVLVRGGNPGENLYLFDNVSLIYVNHIGGFTSVFNPDMINNIDVYKGGFPAKYGGKLSSIMDIAQREGNSTALKGNFSIGLTDASFAIEGPTPLENTTFMVTGRKTMIDGLFVLASRLSLGSDYTLMYGFHDINGKFTWRPNPRNTLSLNVYQGDDYLNFWYKNTRGNTTERAQMQNIWGNWLVSARWNRVHSSNLYSNQSLSFVRYRLGFRQNYSEMGLDNSQNYNHRYLSAVQDLSYNVGFKYDATHFWSMDFGLQTSWLTHNPNSTIIDGKPLGDQAEIQSWESALYIDNALKPTDWLELKIGGRAVSYLTQGYSKFDFEPRASVNIGLNRNHSLHVSYMDVNQFSHLLITQGDIMSNEVWVPARADILPSSTKQVSAGWKGKFLDDMLGAEVSVYHKSLSNLATYREGYTNLMGDKSWQSKVETGGKGEAYGVELMLNKTVGKWTGFAGYSWSRATRQYPSINNGYEYLFDFNRPHSGSLNISRKLNEKLSVSATWVFQSGLPFTPVIGKQLIPSTYRNHGDNQFLYEAFIYGERNSEQMRAFHRLDVALNYTKFSKRSGYKTQWTFALYNAYNRKNPNVYYYTHSKSDGLRLFSSSRFEPYSLYQISFFPIIPTVSYKIFFDETRRTVEGGKTRPNLLKRILFD